MKITKTRKYLLKASQIILYAFSFLCPRNRNKWVFGSYSCFAENPKYLFLFLNNQKRSANIRTIWISKTKKEYEIVSSLGLETYMRWSLKGVFHCLTAKAFIFSSYVSDVNEWVSGRGFKINLWHGVGIKNIERKITRGKTAEIFKEKSLLKKINALPFHIRPDLLLSTSSMMNKHFSSCFDIPSERIIESIYPRCSIFEMEKEKLLSFVEKYEPIVTKTILSHISNFSYVYIYMPTWRDSQKSFLELLNLDLNKINQALADKNSVLIMKLHPVTQKEKIFENMSFSNIVIADPQIDIYPVLPFTDCLITDYSSIYYDYILLSGKRVIFYIPDYDDYIKNERDLAYDFNDFTIGEKIYDSDSLIKALSCIEKEPMNQSRIVESFWGKHKDTMFDLYDKILDRNQ